MDDVLNKVMNSGEFLKENLKNKERMIRKAIGGLE